jgi:hypothetical protein
MEDSPSNQTYGLTAYYSWNYSLTDKCPIQVSLSFSDFKKAKAALPCQKYKEEALDILQLCGLLRRE